MIVIPDDFPSVFEGSPAHERAKKLGDVAVFSERGADAEQELIRRIGRAEVAINIRAHARFSEAVFSACPGLKMVSVWGTGTDNIDLNAAGMRGVTVCNTPGVNAFAVAEHALTLMLAVARKIPTLDAEMRKGKWPRELHTQLVGKTLGVFGMGTIGARVAALGKAIGMDVLGWSALGQEARISKAGATPASKEEILAGADVISLHLRLSSETRGFIGRKEFGFWPRSRSAGSLARASTSSIRSRWLRTTRSSHCRTSSARRTMPARPRRSSVTVSSGPSRTWSTSSGASPGTSSSRLFARQDNNPKEVRHGQDPQVW